MARGRQNRESAGPATLGSILAAHLRLAMRRRSATTAR
jgi:hypothetical protein